MSSPTPARPVASVVDDLAAQFEQYRAGTLSAATMARLIPRTSRRLASACYCGTGDCCATHEEHVSPHTGCALR